MFRLSERLRRIEESYAPDEQRPLRGYLRTMAGYGASVVALAAVAKATGRRMPPRQSAGDVVLVSIATHKLSRLIAKESVTSPLRAPFTRYQAPADVAELKEEVKNTDDPTRHALGELVSCPFCLAVWVATGLTAGLVLVPRFTRLVATTFTAVAASDFLQLAYTAGKNVAERR